MKKGCGKHQRKWESVRAEILGFSLMRLHGVAEGKMEEGWGVSAMPNGMRSRHANVGDLLSVASPSRRCIRRKWCGMQSIDHFNYYDLQMRCTS